MKQITFAPHNHLLTNTNTWTPNSQWLVFDMHPSGASFTSKTIEHVNIHTSEVKVIYHTSQGTHISMVTIHPKSEKYVFIHGPENPDETWHYNFHHQHRVIAEGSKVSNLNAMDITTPYTPGALHSSSHVHVFSPNSERVSFTYNNHVMHELNPALDLQNISVAAPFGPVNIQKQHPREYSSSHWCMLVSKTTPTPQPGSNEINHAYEEGWVGNHTLAFIGNTLSPKGKKVPELFIIELPQDEAGWKAAGDAPLSGTETTLPTPPRSIMQQHLTFTHHQAYPGLVNIPRHWVHCNPQGTQITFLMHDDNSIVQLWLISPQGSKPRQLTHNKTDIQSAFNWHPSGEWLGFVLDNQIACAHAQSSKVEYLTKNHTNPPSTDTMVFSPDGQWLAWIEGSQLWITKTDH